jgi:uncharacterized protein YqgV (UPF0045/DUF77 family)
MIPYNLTPFTGTIDDPACLKQMALVKTPLKTKFEGKAEQLLTHVQEFTRHVKNMGLYQEFQIKLQENDKPDDNQMINQMRTGHKIIRFIGKRRIFLTTSQQSVMKHFSNNMSI